VGLFQDGAQDGDVGHDAAGALEAALGRAGDDLGQGGLAAAGRAVEDDAAQPVGLDASAQRLAGAEHVVLADHLVQRARAHAGGQRGLSPRGRVGRFILVKKFVHGFQNGQTTTTRRSGQAPLDPAYVSH
jgi:hypothetical protein